MEQRCVKYTASEYLALERAAETKSELRDGMIVSVPAVGRHHNLIVSNLASELCNRLRGTPFEVYASAMRVKVSKTGWYLYPDVVVASEEPLFEDETEDSLLNPRVVLEVVTRPARDSAHALKFRHYRTLDSVQEVVFVSQEMVRMEHWRRRPEGNWVLRETENGDPLVRFPSLEINLEIAHVYERVSFGEMTQTGHTPSG